MKTLFIILKLLFVEFIASSLIFLFPLIISHSLCKEKNPEIKVALFFSRVMLLCFFHYLLYSLGIYKSSIRQQRTSSFFCSDHIRFFFVIFLDFALLFSLYITNRHPFSHSSLWTYSVFVSVLVLITTSFRKAKIYHIVSTCSLIIFPVAVFYLNHFVLHDQSTRLNSNAQAQTPIILDSPQESFPSKYSFALLRAFFPVMTTNFMSCARSMLIPRLIPHITCSTFFSLVSVQTSVQPTTTNPNDNATPPFRRVYALVLFAEIVFGITLHLLIFAIPSLSVAIGVLFISSITTYFSKSYIDQRDRFFRRVVIAVRNITVRCFTRLQCPLATNKPRYHTQSHAEPKTNSSQILPTTSLQLPHKESQVIPVSISRNSRHNLQTSQPRTQRSQSQIQVQSSPKMGSSRHVIAINKFRMLTDNHFVSAAADMSASLWIVQLLFSLWFAKTLSCGSNNDFGVSLVESSKTYGEHTHRFHVLLLFFCSIFYEYILPYLFYFFIFFGGVLQQKATYPSIVLKY